jgi:iron complex outermembrane receptor protein
MLLKKRKRRRPSEQTAAELPEKLSSARGYSPRGQQCILKTEPGPLQDGYAGNEYTGESIEVLKGSAALLYGGVSSVERSSTWSPRNPSSNYGAEVSMRAGSYDLYKPTADIYGPIS